MREDSRRRDGEERKRGEEHRGLARGTGPLIVVALPIGIGPVGKVGPAYCSLSVPQLTGPTERKERERAPVREPTCQWRGGKRHGSDWVAVGTVVVLTAAPPEPDRLLLLLGS